MSDSSRCSQVARWCVCSEVRRTARQQLKAGPALSLAHIAIWRGASGTSVPGDPRGSQVLPIAVCRILSLNAGSLPTCPWPHLLSLAWSWVTASKKAEAAVQKGSDCLFSQGHTLFSLCCDTDQDLSQESTLLQVRLRNAAFWVLVFECFSARGKGETYCKQQLAASYFTQLYFKMLL